MRTNKRVDPSSSPGDTSTHFEAPTTAPSVSFSPPLPFPPLPPHPTPPPLLFHHSPASMCSCCCLPLTAIPRSCCTVPSKWAAWVYYVGFLLVTIISWVLRDYGGSSLDFGPATGCSTDNTCGDLAVLRVSFGSVIFFALMALLTLGVTSADNPRLSLHCSFWPIKYV